MWRLTLAIRNSSNDAPHLLRGIGLLAAMARDGLLPSVFATVSRNSRVPTYAVLLLGVCAIAFAISGTFDVLTDMIIFAVSCNGISGPHRV
jgi:amino acid permease